MPKHIMKLKRFNIRDWVLELVLVALIIAFSLATPRFFTGSNLLNILRNISFKGIIALGMTMVIISGEIDLSVGSMVGFAGVLTAFLTQTLSGIGLNLTVAVCIAMVVTLIVAFFIGRFIAFLITRFSIPSFIATLAFYLVLKGAALVISNGYPILGYPKWFSQLGAGYFGPIPITAIFFIVALIIMWYVMKATPFGRSIYAVGSNVEAARLSGINVKKVKGIIFSLTSTFAAVAGILISSQINSGAPLTGGGWEFDVISAVIIGGASLAGGSGTIKGTLIGAIFLGILLNGMTLLNVSDYWKFIVRGGLILIAVLMNTLISRSNK
ncbi:MAG: ABC transporter permease [Clostridia bacterium]|jgi:sugar transport system permease protein|nr:ABC transporter permease [Clostridia bacterium]